VHGQLISQNQSFSAGEMTMNADDHFGIGLTLIDPLLMKIMHSNTIFTFSFPMTLTFDL